MTEVPWPADLPQFPTRNGYREEPVTAVTAFKPEAGPDLAWAHTTVDLTDVTFEFILSYAQRDRFVSWFRRDLARGVNRLTMPHPLTRETRTWAWRLADKPYQISHRGGLEVTLTFTLTELP